MINCVVCVDAKWGIGKNNGLLFNLKTDMQVFKALTMNKIVACGMNTLLSFPDGKPLKGRSTIVLAPEEFEREDCHVVHEWSKFLNLILELSKTQEVFIIGGGMLYKSMLQWYDKLYITKVQADGNAEVFFPNIDELGGFNLVEQSGEYEENGVRFSFCTYYRKA